MEEYAGAINAVNYNSIASSSHGVVNVDESCDVVSEDSEVMLTDFGEDDDISVA